MTLAFPDALSTMVGNDASALTLRIYLVDFAMNTLPVESISDHATMTTTTTTNVTGKSLSTLTTAYPGTLLLGQKPGDCMPEHDDEEPRSKSTSAQCFPSTWLLNTMRFSIPGQFAIHATERNVYYWPAVNTSGMQLSLDDRVAVARTTAIVAAAGSSSTALVEHVAFEGLHFTRCNAVPRRRLNAIGRVQSEKSLLKEDDRGGIQHNWAPLGDGNAAVTLTNAQNIAFSQCTFSRSAGGGIRMDGFARNISVDMSNFSNLGTFAFGVFGNGLGRARVTQHNTLRGSDVTRTARRKFDSPAIVVWNAAYTSIVDNYVHDTTARAAYVGGSRYCAQPTGFATDGGIFENDWKVLNDMSGLPATWQHLCENVSYAYTFADDCKCAFFRGSQGNAITGNIFARVVARKDRSFFSDGVVYISGPGYVTEPSDAVRVVNNTYIGTPGAVGASAFRMLYVDGYTGSMQISGNAVVASSANQGFMLCMWYGNSDIFANALALSGSWGPTYDIASNCDGNPGACVCVCVHCGICLQYFLFT